MHIFPQLFDTNIFTFSQIYLGIRHFFANNVVGGKYDIYLLLLAARLDKRK